MITGVEMADLEKAVATQLSNIEKRTGKSIEELSNIVRASGLSKHGELVAAGVGRRSDVQPQDQAHRRAGSRCGVAWLDPDCLRDGGVMHPQRHGEKLVLPAACLAIFRVADLITRLAFRGPAANWPENDS